MTNVVTRRWGFYEDSNDPSKSGWFEVQKIGSLPNNWVANGKKGWKKKVTWKKPPRSTTNNVYVIEQVQCPPNSQHPPSPLSASVSASSSSSSSSASLASSGPSSGAVSSSSSSATVAAPTGVIGEEQTEFIQQFQKGIASSREALKSYSWDRVVGLENLKGVMQDFIKQWNNPDLVGRRKPNRAMLLYG